MTAADAAKVVLGESGPGLAAYVKPYEGFTPLMPAYRYHFMTHSKPATHLRALAHLQEDEIESATPEVYRRLLKHADDNIRRD